MSLMKAKDQLIHIPLYYMEKEVKGYTKIIILEDDRAKEILAEQEEEKKKKTKKESKEAATIGEKKEEPEVEKKQVETSPVECLNSYWKILSWKEQNQISKMSQVQNSAETAIDIDYFRLRDLRIKMCLKKWDLKDDNGNEVPVKPENIDSLPAEVVYTISSKYDTLVALTEDEIKNL